MTRRMMLAFVMGSALLLSSGPTVKAAREGFTVAPHFSVPRSGVQRIAPVAPFRINHPPASRGDQRFLRTQRRFANRFGAPFSGFWPDIWPDGVVAPATPEVPGSGQQSDTGSGSEDSPRVVAGSDMGSTVIRH